MMTGLHLTDYVSDARTRRVRHWFHLFTNGNATKRPIHHVKMRTNPDDPQTGTRLRDPAGLQNRQYESVAGELMQQFS